MCDGDIFQGNVELVGALKEIGADAVGDGFSLCDELGGVELGDNGLENFVSDRGKDTLVVVEAKVLRGSLLHIGVYTSNDSPGAIRPVLWSQSNREAHT